ncbi:MAG: hypothetical protein R2751_14420 [Bacteroidales bacterium]
METRKVLNRENQPTEQLRRTVHTNYNGFKLTYDEVYYLDEEVDEESGNVIKEKLVPHYTKEQMNRNLRSLKSAYLIEKGAASPDEIIEFRRKHNIAASTLSIIIGFSKNTISNIENEGITSLPSGRLIKMCITDPSLLLRYIILCDAIDHQKKEELAQRILRTESE